jgi:predicted RNA binding protein YcfA (HicA-like mRNA interferase family)
MPKLPRISGSEAIRALKRLGFEQVRQSGSHVVLRKDHKGCVVPIHEAIRFRMEQQGLTVDDLVPVIGRKNRVYEILARKRPLTLRMIEGLHEVFSIPAESLLKHGSEHSSHAA